MDAEEKYYRTWLAEHSSPAERAEFQALHGMAIPANVVVLTMHPDGEPLGVNTTPNPHAGLWTLPPYVLAWDPNDDNPTNPPTQEEQL